MTHELIKCLCFKLLSVREVYYTTINNWYSEYVVVLKIKREKCQWGIPERQKKFITQRKDHSEHVQESSRVDYLKAGTGMMVHTWEESLDQEET